MQTVMNQGDDLVCDGRAIYVVGQDRSGRWMVMETLGRGGGLFASRDAALVFARSESGCRPGAVRLSSEPIGWV